MYSNHLAVHIDASKERILKETKKKYEIEEMPRACVTRLLATVTLATPLYAQPDPSKIFGEQALCFLNKRAATAVSTYNNRMFVVKNRPAESELPSQPNTFVDATFYIKLRATLGIIFVLGWGFFIRQYQFNKLDDRMSKLKKGQNVNKSKEETAVKLDGEMSMDAELISKFIIHHVAAAMVKKINQYKNII